MCFRLRNMSLFCKDKKKGNVNILFSYLTSEKIWITFCNVFVFHQYTIHLFYLKHFDTKNMKVKCAIERQTCFSFFHVGPFSIQFQTNCHLNYILKKYTCQVQIRDIENKKAEFQNEGFAALINVSFGLMLNKNASAFIFNYAKRTQ